MKCMPGEAGWEAAGVYHSKMASRGYGWRWQEGLLTSIFKAVSRRMGPVTAAGFRTG